MFSSLRLGERGGVSAHLLILVLEEREVRLILLAEAEEDDTFEAFRGDAGP